MKKIIGVALVTLSMVLFLSGCAVGETGKHNTLVDKLDAVVSADQVFYGELENYELGGDTSALRTSFDSFKVATVELDTFFSETKLDKAQESFQIEYDVIYKKAVDSYLSKAEEVVEAIESGVNEEELNVLFEEIVEPANDFIEADNSMTEAINKQA